YRPQCRAGGRKCADCEMSFDRPTDRRSTSTASLLIGLTLSAYALRLVLAQVLMHEADNSRPFAHGRGDALDRALASVARCEHARHAGLEWQGITVMVPSRARLLEDVSTRYEIALRVPGDLVGEPLSVRF